MANPQAVQEVKELSRLLNPLLESVPEEIRGVVVQSSHEYVKALRQVGAESNDIQQYVQGEVEIAKDMHAMGMNPGQVKKFLDEENTKSVQSVMQERDQAMIQQMQASQQEQSIRAMQDNLQSSMLRGAHG
tara:strand:- start:359 stop:751 length:393 start_codon:yes stop_codon:yes gene_type:complete